MQKGGNQQQRAVALGKVQRRLLVEASAGPTRVTQGGGTDGANKVRHKAAAALVDLGLAEVHLTDDRPAAKIMVLTPIGTDVVVQFAWPAPLLRDQA